MKFLLTLSILCSLFYLITIDCPAQNNGSIQGTVADATTRQAIAGATVRVLGTKFGAISTAKGSFSIRNVPPKVYTVQISSVGYTSIVLTDIVVHNARSTTLSAELHPSTTRTEDVTVQADYFSSNESSPNSALVFSAEEIRRAPGSAGDINRVLSSSPAVGRIDDSRADLSIRGGSPSENAFYVDNIPFININYFPKQGATGGPISFLNISQVKRMSFLSGGFDASHEALSGVIDISLRDPNTDQFGADLEFNMIGVGAAIEGPIGDQSSYYFSATRGYLDLLKGLLDQTGTAQWANAQTKLSLKLGPNDRLSIIGVSALSDFLREKSEALSTNTSDNHNQQWQNMYGCNWQHLLATDGYTNTSVSLNTLHSFEISRFPQNDSVFFDNETSLRIASIRNVTHLVINQTFSTEFGLDLRAERQQLRSFVPAQFNAQGSLDSSLHEFHDVSVLRTDFFATLSAAISSTLCLNTGLRVDHSSYTVGTEFQTVLLPRVSLLWNPSPEYQISAAYGLYSQPLPLGMLQYSLQNGFPTRPVVAQHSIVSVSWLASADTRLSLEAYDKHYSNMPIDIAHPYKCPLDAAIADFDFDQVRAFTFNGTARSYGAELSLQKKMSASFYFMIGASLTRSTYVDGSGVERNRSFDNRFLVNGTAGWRIGDEWELSAQATVVGGNATTPLDSAASRLQGKEVWAGPYMSDHLPLYKIVNLRLDKRFHLASSNLVVYLTLLNALDLHNVKSIEYNPYSKTVVQPAHIGLLPILGIEWQL